MKILKFFKSRFKKNNVNKPLPKTPVSKHTERIFRFDSDHRINKICYACYGRKNAINVIKRDHKFTRYISNSINILKSPDKSTILLKRKYKNNI